MLAHRLGAAALGAEQLAGLELVVVGASLAHGSKVCRGAVVEVKGIALWAVSY